MYSVERNENDLTSELTSEELDMIQRSLLVIIPRQYIEKLLRSECTTKEEYLPKQSPVPSKDLTEPALPSNVIVIEPETELFISVTESIDKSVVPTHSSIVSHNACAVSPCAENEQTAPTENVGRVIMTSENTNASTLVSCGEIIQNGFLENSSTGKNVGAEKVFVQANTSLQGPSDSSGVDSRRQFSICGSPVESHMAAAPQFLKTDSDGRSSSTSKSESAFSPSHLKSIQLKADLGSVSALFPKFRRFRSRIGCSRRKLFNHGQVLTAGDEFSDSSSSTHLSFMGSDGETLSCRDIRGDAEHCIDNTSIPVCSPEVLFQKPLIRSGSSGRKKRKLFNGSEVLCTAADKGVSPQKETSSETTVSPVNGKTSCLSHHVDKHIQKVCSTVQISSHRVGEGVPSSISVPISKLYSETLALCLKKRSKSNRISAESTDKEKDLTDEQNTTELDSTAATEKSPNRPCSDGANSLVPDVLPVESDIVNAVKIQELLSASRLSSEQHKAMNDKPFADKLMKFAFSHFREYNT